MREDTYEFIGVAVFILLIVGSILIFILISNHHTNKINIQCQELGWEEGAGQCYCKNTTYNTNTGDETIIKQEYKEIFGCV